LAGIKVGQNTFELDTTEAERKLLSDPWVRAARITRKLPRGVQVEVSEHEARALVSLGPALFLVTRSGEPFKRFSEADPYDIPIITGISEAGLARDRAREVERIALGLEVLGHYERLVLAHAFAAQEVHIDAAGAVTLVVGSQGVSLRLGKGPWLMKLRMAERVMGKVQRQGKVPGIIFLDNDAHQERVVVRMR
jgi:cell division protein FtsQ